MSSPKNNPAIVKDDEEYDAVIQERDQLKINLYIIANNLKDQGFHIADQANSIQKLGNDLMLRIKLSPKQIELMQQTLSTSNSQS